LPACKVASLPARPLARSPALPLARMPACPLARLPACQLARFLPHFAAPCHPLARSRACPLARLPARPVAARVSQECSWESFPGTFILGKLFPGTLFILGTTCPRDYSVLPPNRNAGLDVDESETLLTHSFREFEDSAVRLGRSPQLLRRLRRSLLVKAPSSPLFDTKTLTHNMERAYEALWDLYLADGQKIRRHLVLPKSQLSARLIF
jgi:hypothetical protein